MAFENKTIEQVNNLIISGIEAELNTKFRLLPKSFIRVLAKVLSAVFITLYKQQAWIFLQMFVDTASFDEVEILGRKIRPLVMWGNLVGIGDPEGATQWQGKIKVEVASVNTYLDQGTQFVDPATGLIYITNETVLLKNPFEEIAVKCAESGIAGNIEVDDELNVASPYFNIGKKAVVSEVTDKAVDEESESSYRSRVKSRWQVQPQGGALYDYRKWASDVAGVLQTYIYKDDDSAAGVLIYVVSDDESRIATPGMLKEVGEACSYDPVTGEGRKPVTAVLDPANDGSYGNVRACSISSFTVYVDDFEGNEIDSFKSSCKTNFGSYFLEREPFVRGLSVDNNRADRISSVNLTSIANDIAEGVNGYFEKIRLEKNGEIITDYTLGKGELAKLEKLYVNGVEV